MRRRDDYLEIRWYDATAALTSAQFNDSLARFGDAVGPAGRRGILVDATRFLMAPEHMSMEWRDKNIIPKYNAAGVAKFAS
ncbi:MAG: hypothetical protein O3C25_00055 [Chloroflexi bacterium]|nr:hypothetical protein [Chloroflexota bacterium]